MVRARLCDWLVVRMTSGEIPIGGIALPDGTILLPGMPLPAPNVSRSFTDDHITAIVAGLIKALRPRGSYGSFGDPARDAMREATDIMAILRGEPTSEDRWQQQVAGWQREAAERETEITRTLATGCMHSASR